MFYTYILRELLNNFQGVSHSSLMPHLCFSSPPSIVNIWTHVFLPLLKSTRTQLLCLSLYQSKEPSPLFWQAFDNWKMIIDIKCICSSLSSTCSNPFVTVYRKETVFIFATPKFTCSTITWSMLLFQQNNSKRNACVMACWLPTRMGILPSFVHPFCSQNVSITLSTSHSSFLRDIISTS